MQVIERGRYLANAVLTEFPSMRAQDMPFVSNKINFVALVPIWSNISLMTGNIYLTYSNSYDPVNDVYAVTVVYTFATGTWTDDLYRTIVVQEDTQVEQIVKLWFDENFTFLPDSGTEPEPEPDPEPSVDVKPVYIRHDGVWSKKEAYEYQNGQWIMISSKELP